jgi:hypothetical protein
MSKDKQWKLVDEIGTKLTIALSLLDKACYPYDELLESKDLLNQLKSEMMKEKKNV